MRYYSLDELKEHFGQDFSLDKLASYTSENKELDDFIGGLQKKNNRLFFQWVEQLSGLKSILIGAFSKQEKFKDTIRLLEHQFAEEFKAFISPFLAPKILASCRENEQKITPAMSYCQLLENDVRLLVESEIGKVVQQLFVPVENLHTKDVGEKELSIPVQKSLSDDAIEQVNLLSRGSYAIKVNYVDNALAIVRANSCTIRLANWILKRLELIELNPEHVEKVNELRYELKTGKVQVKNQFSSTKKSIPWKKAGWIASFAGIVILLFWVVKEQPFSTPDEPNLADNSSFKKFSKEERKELDSLLKTIAPDRELEQENIDLGQYMAEELDLVLREKFQNRRAEKYYSDLSTEIATHDIAFPDSCENTGATTANPTGMQSASIKTGGKQGLFKNESEYDVQIIVFQNKTSAPVYYSFLPQGEKATINLDAKDHFIVIPGSNLVDYQAPNSNSPLPSEDFNQVFCNIDLNYYHGLNTTYSILPNTKKLYKFLLVGDASSRFELLDLYKVLDVD